MVAMVWKRVMSAAVVEPVGLKANWSEKVRAVGGRNNEGYM
jgi:hypothetical protein